MANEQWIKIDDSRIRHVWVKDQSDDCGDTCHEVFLSPSFYQENGTPICMCGEDMVYSHTEIKEIIED
jgi:hypothetical protein